MLQNTEKSGKVIMIQMACYMVHGVRNMMTNMHGVNYVKKTFRVDGMGKCALKQHANYKIHKEKLVFDSQENQEIQQNQQVYVQNEIENIDDCISKAEILWSLLCVEHDLSFLVNDHTYFQKCLQTHLLLLDTKVVEQK